MSTNHKSGVQKSALMLPTTDIVIFILMEKGIPSIYKFVQRNLKINSGMWTHIHSTGLRHSEHEKTLSDVNNIQYVEHEKWNFQNFKNVAKY